MENRETEHLYVCMNAHAHTHSSTFTRPHRKWLRTKENQGKKVGNDF